MTGLIHGPSRPVKNRTPLVHAPAWSFDGVRQAFAFVFSITIDQGLSSITHLATLHVLHMNLDGPCDAPLAFGIELLPRGMRILLVGIPL